MDNRFFEAPILNGPYAYPIRHWELDDQGQPTQRFADATKQSRIHGTHGSAVAVFFEREPVNGLVFPPSDPVSPERNCA